MKHELDNPDSIELGDELHVGPAGLNQVRGVVLETQVIFEHYVRGLTAGVVIRNTKGRERKVSYEFIAEFGFKVFRDEAKLTDAEREAIREAGRREVA